jgi:hypothetical protein
MRAALKPKTLGVAGVMAAVAMMIVAAFGAGSASAAEWGECTKVTATPEFKDSLCNEEGRGEFTWKAFTTTKAVTSTDVGGLRMTDKKGGAFGEEVTIECNGTDEGTVGPGSKDQLTKATATACKTLKGICESPVAHALHLPWNTTLETVGGEVRDKIENSGAGAPGWDVTCVVGGFIKVEDECTGETTTAVANVSGGVALTFDAKSAKANCTRGGAGEGSVLGKDLVENPTGVQLSVK